MTHANPHANNGPVQYPKLTGDSPDQWVVIASRGEPRRSNGRMQNIVFQMVGKYLDFAEIEVSGVLLGLTVQLIARDHIDPPGSQGVMMQASHVLAYLDIARKALDDLEKHDA